MELNEKTSYTKIITELSTSEWVLNPMTNVIVRDREKALQTLSKRPYKSRN